MDLSTKQWAKPPDTWDENWKNKFRKFNRNGVSPRLEKTRLALYDELICVEEWLVMSINNSDPAVTIETKKAAAQKIIGIQHRINEIEQNYDNKTGLVLNLYGTFKNPFHSGLPNSPAYVQNPYHRPVWFTWDDDEMLKYSPEPMKGFHDYIMVRNVTPFPHRPFFREQQSMMSTTAFGVDTTTAVVNASNNANPPATNSSVHAWNIPGRITRERPLSSFNNLSCVQTPGPPTPMQFVPRPSLSFPLVSSTPRPCAQSPAIHPRDVQWINKVLADAEKRAEERSTKIALESRKAIEAVERRQREDLQKSMESSKATIVQLLAPRLGRDSASFSLSASSLSASQVPAINGALGNGLSGKNSTSGAPASAGYDETSTICKWHGNHE